MKNLLWIFTIALLTAWGVPSFAADAPTEKDMLTEPRDDVYQRNTASLEIMGRGGYYSLNFDRIIVPSVAIGVGFSYTPIADDSSNTKMPFYIVPIYSNAYLLGANGTHRGFVTLGVSLVRNTRPDRNNLSNSFFNPHASFSTPIIAGFGYEYRGWDCLLFRVTPYLIEYNSHLAVSLGASLGLAF